MRAFEVQLEFVRDGWRGLGVEEFNDYLNFKNFPGSVLDSFLLNEISGSIFLLMEEDDLKELVPITGYRIKVRELLTNQKQKHVSYYPSWLVVAFVPHSLSAEWKFGTSYSSSCSDNQVGLANYSLLAKLYFHCL